MAYQTGTDFKFEIDPTGGSTYVELGITSLTGATNETVDTFFKFTDDGFATNVVTSVDPQFTTTIKGDSSDTTLVALLDKRYSLSRTVGIKITDNINAEVLTATAVLTSISDPRTVGTVTELTLVFKLVGKPTIA